MIMLQPVTKENFYPCLELKREEWFFVGPERPTQNGASFNTSAEAKATYKEIEEWVQEHYGFHVTNLNLAQVKQKHGIIERENYNKPKSENSRQPGCPEEKVKAIEDALRHFQMI